MPIFEVCEEFQVNAMVVNAFHVKNVPGRKTDENDSEWLAKLSMSGLLNKSFIPGKDLREIRAVTRYRKKVVQNLASEKNRLAKYLDASGIRIGNVVSKIDGVSASLIIDHLLDKGELTLNDLTLYTKGCLKAKKEELLLALDGRLSDRHKVVLKSIRNHIEYLEKLKNDLSEVIAKAMGPYQKEWEVLQTIPGFDTHSAASLLAEIGNDMSHFKTSKNLSSWAGVAPGNNESAGKKKVQKLRKVTLT
jgi:transposase